MNPLERRLLKLEQRPGNEELKFMQLLLKLLASAGYEETCARMCPTPEYSMVDILHNATSHYLFDLEKFRGLVPDEDIRNAYGKCRNYVFTPETRERVWKLAGLLPEEFSG